MSVDSIVTQVTAAIAVIIGVSYLVGQLFRKLRQPEVIGQLLTGIALGPSALGHFAPGVEHAIFPAKIIPFLTVTSQVALVFFLFAVGYELDLPVLRRLRTSVTVVSAAGFAVPAAFGVLSVFLLAGWFGAVGEAAPAQNAAFILFMGVALSVTAVPVLASILGERRLTATIPGVTAMTSAAVIDALDWLVLAGVLVVASVAGRSHRPWGSTMLELLGYIAAGILVVRPVLRRWLSRRDAVAAVDVPLAVALAMTSAWITGWLGLHVILGAFFAGLIMPRQPNGGSNSELLRPVSWAGRLLLPIFFVVAGLSVNIAGLHRVDFELLGVICVIAMAGKMGAGFLGGVLTRLTRRDSLIVGILLNARGLTELIALNIGLAAQGFVKVGVTECN